MEISIRQLAFASLWVSNTFFILFILCVERKKPAFALSWILTLIFLPAIGFVLYLFLGTNIAVKRHNTRKGSLISLGYSEKISDDNDIDLFITAKAKYRKLLDDIEAAEDSIHVLYFIIRNDRIGRLLLDLLLKKAKQGVEVRLLYDHAGCWFTPGRLFKPLSENGAQVRRFFPINLDNYLRINFRNHRKIVVIDGKIGYIGGMNIGEEYMATSLSILPWRDTHLRLVGSAVQALQQRFLLDWCFSGKTDKFTDFETERFFPVVESGGKVKIKIVSSGPSSEAEAVKWSFLQMIYAAKRQILIQTPYFVPDDSFMEALRIAAYSGVKIVIMAPAKTDNYLAHKVSLSYLGELLKAGVRVYFYPGFIHAKMLVIDDKIVSIGSANLDMRSFSLNFETNALIYDTRLAKECVAVFAADMKNSQPMLGETYQNRSVFVRVQEGVFRLLAPLL